MKPDIETSEIAASELLGHRIKEYEHSNKDLLALTKDIVFWWKIYR